MLATPGPTKYSMVEGRKAPLRPIWNRARKVLCEADAIVFVGYRMPATDAHTKQWLIDCLRQRLGTFPFSFERPGFSKLAVHTVLGPDTGHEHSRRLKGSLDEVHPALGVRQWEMGAEDFLGLVSRKTLLAPIWLEGKGRNPSQ